MDDEKSSEKKYIESSSQIEPLEYPIFDGSGKQYNLKYAKYVSSSNIFPSLLPKIPLSSNFKSYEEYSYNMKKWYSTMKASFSRCILPTNISLFYRRPLKTKTLGRGKNLVTFDQLLEIEQILINEQKFDRSTFFKNNIKSKSNLISEYISYYNSWIGWTIPPFPEPEYFNNIEDFFLAANNWYNICNKILNKDANKFIFQSKSNGNKDHNSHHSRKISNIDNKIYDNGFSSGFFNIKKEYSNDSILKIQPLQYQSNKSENNDNENVNDSEESINSSVLNDDNLEKMERGADYSDMDNISLSENIEIDSSNDDNENSIKTKFDFLLHPISFHNKYNFEIVPNKISSNMKTYQNKSIPIKNISQNTFINTIQNQLKINFNEDSKTKEIISNSLKDMDYFELKNEQISHSIKNPTIIDLENLGCFTPIRNSYLIPSFDNDASDDNFISVRNFLYLIDLDSNKISKTECDSLFQYILSNHNNEIFQNLLNNTQFLYKVAIILSYYVPSSSIKDIQIIQPFDENDSFLSINDFGEFFQFTPEIQTKLDLREIHGLLFQWHFSDVIHRIFGLIQNEKASETFLKRSLFYKSAFDKFAEEKSFPFSFIPTPKKSENENTKVDKIQNNETMINNENDLQNQKEIDNNNENANETQNDIKSQKEIERNQKINQFYKNYKFLSSSYNGYYSPNLSQFIAKAETSKTMDNIPFISHIKLQSSSSEKLKTNKKSTVIDFTSDSFISLATSIFKVSLLYDVSTFVCPSCFKFLYFVSKNSKDNQKFVKKFMNEILFNRKMCIQFIKDFTGYSMHLRFDISDSHELLQFSCLLFQVDINSIFRNGSFKITDFEWVIQFFQHIARYLIDSYIHVFLTECILRFVLHSINSDNFCEWNSNIKTLQGLLYAYIPYESNKKILASELRSFSLLMKSNESFSFFDSDEKIEKIFRFVIENDHDEVLEASWKLLSVLFYYHSESIASYISKFSNLSSYIEKAVSSLKLLNHFDLAACQLLKLLAKLIEASFPLRYTTKSKTVDYRNYFVILSSKNAAKGLAELMRILSKNQISPNYLCFMIRNWLKKPENLSYSHYIKIVERYETAVASRPAMKKMFIYYNIDYEIKK